MSDLDFEYAARMSARHAAGRSWLEDVFEDCPDELSDYDVFVMIRRHYEGGWTGFVRDSE